MEKIVIIGNCQCSPLARLLAAMCPDITFVAVKAVHRIEPDEVTDFLASIDSYAAIITQPVAAGYRNNIGIDTNNIRDKMRADQQLVIIPNLYFEGFFPTWGYMKYKHGNLRGAMPQGLVPKCASEGIFAILRKMDYNDFLLLAAWFNGLSVNQTAALLEHAIAIDEVKVWSNESLSEFALREQACHTHLAPLLQNIIARPAYRFYSFNHPNKALLTELALQILEILAVIPKENEAVRNSVAKLPDRLEHIQLPIYPFVSASLGMKIGKDVNLKIDESVFSIYEFVKHYYAYFDCLGRAGLAVNCIHNKFKLCEKILQNDLLSYSVGIV